MTSRIDSLISGCAGKHCYL